jgi:hypothetical protein
MIRRESELADGWSDRYNEDKVREEQKKASEGKSDRS